MKILLMSMPDVAPVIMHESAFHMPNLGIASIGANIDPGHEVSRNPGITHLPPVANRPVWCEGPLRLFADRVCRHRVDCHRNHKGNETRAHKPQNRQRSHLSRFLLARSCHTLATKRSLLKCSEVTGTAQNLYVT